MPYLKDVVGFCVFSGQPILREEIKAPGVPSGIQSYWQTIVVKYDGMTISKKRRLYSIRTEELSKSVMRNKLFVDMMNIEINLEDIQNAFNDVIKQKELAKQVEEYKKSLTIPAIITRLETTIPEHMKHISEDDIEVDLEKNNG